MQLQSAIGKAQRVTRRSWESRDITVLIIDGANDQPSMTCNGTSVYFILETPHCLVNHWCPAIDDLYAEDWEVIV